MYIYTCKNRMTEIIFCWPILQGLSPVHSWCRKFCRKGSKPLIICVWSTISLSYLFCFKTSCLDSLIQETCAHIQTSTLTSLFLDCFSQYQNCDEEFYKESYIWVVNFCYNHDAHLCWKTNQSLSFYGLKRGIEM